MDYASLEVVDSSKAPGICYTVVKMSFARRVELTRSIRDLAARKEFADAGDTPGEKMEAMLLASEIDRIYLLWGLKEVSGLQVDGLPATPELLASNGPEELFREALAAVKKQCGLTEPERKN